MSKKIWFFLLILLIFNKLHAQQANENLYLKKYSYSSFNKNNSGFYLLQFTQATPETIQKKLKLLAVRKLSPFLYIINYNPTFFSALDKRSFFIYKANNLWKLSKTAEEFALKNKGTFYRFTIEISDLSFVNNVVSKHFPTATVYAQRKMISVVTNYDSITNYFLADNRVIHIDIIASKPAAELGIPGFDLSANNISPVHNNYPFVKGEKMHVSLKEDYFDTTDIDLKGRFDPSPLASQNITNHANYMATIIAGAGNSVHYAEGVAPETYISSSSFKEILPDEDLYYTQNNITVQNHSYGTVIDNHYGLNAVAFDKNANTDTALLHVFSSGNSGNQTSEAGIYSGITGFANLTGNFKMSKNVITVGATDTFGNPVVLSSKGPAYDGRIKPDISAFQINGTSESAALVSGTALLMQQLYKSKNNNKPLPSALARAILINSADDVSNPGPDYATGFGNLNAQKAMKTIDEGDFFSGTISNGETQVFNLTIPSGVSLFKVSVAWNDTVALPEAPAALVNDLDLSVSNKASEEIWQPWVLSSTANFDSLSKIAVRKRDSLNNEEQVTISNPAAGDYQVMIKGFDVASLSQKFYITYSLDSANSFKWKKPFYTDFIPKDNQEMIRWETNIAGSGIIEYALPPFNMWKEIQQRADLSKKYVYWNTPDTISTAMLRMKAGNRFFYSDTFLITALTKPTTGFLCGDSLFIYWNKMKGVKQYQVYQLSEKYMEPLIKTNDTTATLSVSQLKNNYLSVAPILPDGIPGIKSYAFDFTSQNAGCFISSFYADTNDTTATLSLILGTLYKVDSIIIQKNTTTGFKDIGLIPVSNALSYQYSYEHLAKGVTFFRAKIVLNNGKIFYSDKISVYYNKPGKYLIFPVPVTRNQNIEIYTPIPAEEVLILTDMSGRIVLKKEIQFVHEFIPTTNLLPGVYFYKIIKKDGDMSIGKIVVL